MNRRVIFNTIRVCALLTAALACVSAVAETNTNQTARVKVSGYGFFGNREMTRLLRNFTGSGKLPTTLDRTFVQDAALVLFARANSQGYLAATMRAEFKMTDGSRQEHFWTNAMAAELPPEFTASEARFRLERGKRFYYRNLTVEGVHAISEREARGYFVGSDTLLVIRANRIFNPGLLKRSLASLREAYARIGYREAVVNATEVRTNAATGAMSVTVQVQEGLPSVIRSVAVKVEQSGTPPTTNHWMLHPGTAYGDPREQELKRQLQDSYIKLGYPDASAGFTQLKRDVGATNVQVDLAAHVRTGPFIRLGEVHYDGNRKTHVSVIRSRVNLEEGEPLNRLDAERSRARLARLGVFDTVALKYEQVDESTRNVLYEMKEGKRLSLAVLAGYGSYELLRGGLEFEHHNVWGLAHDIRLRGIQSFKASSGDLLYTIPEALGENLNLFMMGSGLLREEETFTRQEYGGSIGMQKRFTEIQTELSVHYDYEFLRAVDLNTTSTNFLGVTDARAATFNIELNHDRRDNPLLPKKGLKLFTKIELGSEALGGNVNYQRFIMSGSYHLDLNGGRLLHLGISHGLTFTWGGEINELPFNKRYFPGGENSLRGYQDGGASPLDADGNQLGAETYTIGNLEFEQLLTRSWSLVAFIDAGGVALSRDDYPWDETFLCAGGGIRWRSPIGPVRLEYGHNVNPRPHDPSGTLHLSIGFPF